MDYDITPYDDSTPQGLLEHAKKLIGKTFADVLHEATRGEFDYIELNGENFDEHLRAFVDKARKGGLGNLLEVVYFGYSVNSTSEPDFPRAGIELKATPYEKGKSGQLRAGERLVLSMIPHNHPLEGKVLEESHLWHKCKHLLLIFYLRDKKLCNLLYRIDFVDLFTPSEADLVIIRKDFLLIAEKVRSGRAHELSEGDTIYLGACTKGATSEKSLKPQFYNKSVPAKTRAWCYKQSYMTFLLRNYFSKGKSSYGTIFVGSKKVLIRNLSFSQALERIIQPYIGKTVVELSKRFSVNSPNAKNFYSMLGMRMLGIRDKESAEEFVKAGITVKAIRLEKDGAMREHFRLFDADFEEMDQAKSFEESALGKFLEKAIFYILVFQDGKDGYFFKGAFLWHMPYGDLQRVEKEFLRAQKVVQNGILFTVKTFSDGKKTITNNLPKPEKDEITHIRTHATNSFYMFADARGEVGKGKKSDTVVVPHTSHRCTRHAYWLNKWYVVKQIGAFLGHLAPEVRSAD